MTHFFGTLNKIVGTPLPPSYHCLIQRGGMEILSMNFYKNMKDTLSQGMSYITHYVVFHPFPRRPHFLLTFIRHMTLIKSNLI